MSSPNAWRMIVAQDGSTEIRVRRSQDGTLTVRLSVSGLAITAAISTTDQAFLFADDAAPASEQAAA